MPPALSNASETDSTRGARRRDIEGFLALGLTAVLFAIPITAKWLTLPAMPMGIPIFLLALVFGLRASRSRRGGGIAARISLAVILVSMIVSTAVVIKEGFREMAAEKHESR
jgi:hypothetical protein